MEATMYYGMDFNPFTKGISSNSLYESNDYKQMMNRLDFVIKTKGIGVFLANPGLGKTTILRAKLESLSENRYKIIYICMTTVSTMDFYRMINDQLGLEETLQKSKMVRQIKEEIRRIVEEAKKEVIIVIDEAQFLSREIIKEFIMFMNYNYDSKDYCTLILIGQNDFVRLLRYKNLEAFTQRINVNYSLTGMNEEEVENYVIDRLRLVHCQTDLFQKESYHTLFTISNGSIRILNRLIERALIIGTKRGIRNINSEVIMDAQREVFNA